MNLTQLRNLASSLKLIRFSSLRKAELQALVDAKQNNQPIPVKYIHPGVIFKKMLGLPIWGWCIDELKILPGKYLQALCIVMGIPKSGTKTKLLDRLLSTAEVRKALADFKPQPQQQSLSEIIQNPNFSGENDSVLKLANAYKGEELKALCKKVRAFAGSTKYAMAASLLNWKIQSSKKGADAFQQVIATLKGQS